MEEAKSKKENEKNPNWKEEEIVIEPVLESILPKTLSYKDT